jgi:hypothetical protein
LFLDLADGQGIASFQVFGARYLLTLRHAAAQQ